MAGLDPGTLDRFVTIERPTLVNDGYGDPQPSWAALTSVWAQFIPGQGYERFANAQAAALAPATFVIYWSEDVADVNPKDRIRHPAPDGTAFDIVRVEEIGRREGLRIFGVAVAD